MDVPFFTSNLIRTFFSYKMSNYESHIADMERYLQSNNVGRIVSTPANAAEQLSNSIPSNWRQALRLVPMSAAIAKLLKIRWIK